MLYYALLATLGSVAGCLVLFLLARKGGEAFLRKRLHERHVDRATAVFRKYGLLAVLVPSLLPPPVPFKIFVLAAGVAASAGRLRRRGGDRPRHPLLRRRRCWRCGTASAAADVPARERAAIGLGLRWAAALLGGLAWILVAAPARRLRPRRRARPATN